MVDSAYELEDSGYSFLAQTSTTKNSKIQIEDMNDPYDALHRS